MKLKTILLLCCSFLVFHTAISQEKKCCEIPACKERSEELAARITGLAAFIKCEISHPEINQRRLDSLKTANNLLYGKFIQAMSELVKYMNDHHNDLCFANRLPEDDSDNIFDWITYFNDKEHPVKFPSSEFCGGWKKRFEINQGAGNIFKKSMTYSGSLRSYIMYTFLKKDSCGGRVRLMAGPAVFLRGNQCFVTLNTRAAFKIKDIAPKNFSLGNINIFGEYVSNFKRFNNVAAGVEAELGSFGVNLAVNMDTKTQSAGFLVGLVFSNKKLK